MHVMRSKQISSWRLNECRRSCFQKVMRIRSIFHWLNADNMRPYKRKLSLKEMLPTAFIWRVAQKSCWVKRPLYRLIKTGGVSQLTKQSGMKRWLSILMVRESWKIYSTDTSQGHNGHPIDIIALKSNKSCRTVKLLPRSLKSNQLRLKQKMCNWQLWVCQ